MPTDDSSDRLSLNSPSYSAWDRTGDFAAPWCKAIIDDPQWKKMPVGWQAPMSTSFGANELWSTLSTPRAMRAVLGLIRAEPDPSVRSGPDRPDVMMLLSMGEGLMGAPGRLHGGFTATVLDMITGFAINATEEVRRIATANLNVDYKAPCPLPTIALAKAWITKREGRKRTIQATFEDQNGKIMATATAIYVAQAETTAESSVRAKI